MKKIIVLLSTLFATTTAFAHPHAWLYVKNNVVIENEKLTSFEMTWTMDEISSSQIIYEMKTSKDKQKTRKEITNDMIETSIGNHYFSELYDENHKPIKFVSKPDNAYFEIENNRVMFHVVFSVAKPRAVAGKTFELKTFEPSYYMAMTYDDEGKPLTLTGSDKCKATLHAPNVNAQLKEYAANLDKDQTPDESLSLGSQFAEKVKIVCQK